jgi:4-hydroxy-3-polyprenylbenzoate decarboxylase
MRIVVAVTGASGTVIAERLLSQLADHETHLIISNSAREVAKEEGVSISKLSKTASKTHDVGDFHSPLASSSHRIDAMVVVPCSMKSLSAIANGYAEDLIVRTAENALKMGWKLVVVPRETPLSLSAIENMRKIKLAGGLVLPANVAYYTKPKTIDDVTDFIVGKILDALAIENKLYPHWKEGK